jgi:hypothetical protein
VHEFTGVFNGTPTEVTTTPWPVAITGATSTTNVQQLTSVVFDETRDVLYVGDFDGRDDWVNVATGAVTASSGFGDATDDMYDAPLVDPTQGTNGEVYQQVGTDGTDAAIVQLAGEFASGAAETNHERTGAAVGNTGGDIFTGSFDNTYYTSSVGTGHLIFCGANTGPTGHPELYTITITANVMTAIAADVSASTSATAQCSSITEVYNGTTDYVYTSVSTGGVPAGCGGAGCVLAYSVNAGTGALTSSGSAPYSGGTSGVIIDNFQTAVGGAQIYFSPLTAAACTTSGTGGCAVQAAQITP